MIYGYARVSTKGQSRYGASLEVQEEQLRKFGADAVYSDVYTGAKTDRPELTKLLEVMEEGDTFMVTKLDRIARSIGEGVTFFDALNERGITVHVLNMGVIDNSPSGRLVRNIMLSFAEYERDMITIRTHEAIDAKKAADPNFKVGRKEKEVPKFDEYEKRVKGGDITIAEACRELGISRGKWYSMVQTA